MTPRSRRSRARGALAVAYYRSPDFVTLRASTKVTYRGIIDRWRAEHGAKRVTHLMRRHVQGFGNWFRDACDLAGLKGRSAHGLRKAAARRLAEAGCSALQIGAITGHKTLKEISRYTAAADQERMARDAVDKLA